MGVGIGKCKDCFYHADNWTCTNAESSYVGDFTDNEDWCSHYENDGSDIGLSQPSDSGT